MGGIDVSTVLNTRIASDTLVSTYNDSKFSCLIQKFRIAPNVIINGISLGNGQKINIGDQFLSVSIQHVLCSPYVC